MNDKHLADKGWRAMEALLDEHMPTPRRRRRVVAWWWLLLIGGSLAVSIWWRYLRPTSPQPLTAPAPEQPVATRIAQPDNSQATTAIPPPTLPLPIAAQPPIEAHTHRLRAMPMLGVGAESQGLAACSGQAPLDESTSLPTSEVSTRLAGRALALLPGAVRALSSPERLLTMGALAPVENALPQPAKTHPLSWGVMAGGFALFDGSACGGMVGLYADWAMGARWGLRSGLAYRYYRFASSVPNSTSRVFLDGSNVQLPSSSGALTGDGVWVSLSEVHRLEVPVQIYWHVGKRLRLYAGSAWNVAVAHRVRSALEVQGQTLEIADVSEVSSLVGEYLARWEGHAAVAAGYALGQRFELQAQVGGRLFSAPRLQGKTGGATGFWGKDEEDNWQEPSAGERFVFQLSVLGRLGHCSQGKR